MTESPWILCPTCLGQGLGPVELNIRNDRIKKMCETCYGARVVDRVTGLSPDHGRDSFYVYASGGN